MVDYILQGYVTLGLTPEAEYAKGGHNDWLVQDFKVEREGEQPQLRISWQLPVNASAVTELKLVRKAYTYPESHSDGTIVAHETNLRNRQYYHSDMGEKVFRYEGEVALNMKPSSTVQLNAETPVESQPTPVIPVDAGVSSVYDTMEPHVPYFYTMYSLTPLGWLTGARAKASEIPGEPYFLFKLWEMIPHNIQRKDQDVANQGAVMKQLEQVTSEGRTFNRYEMAEQGQLERFLKVFAYQLDYIKDNLDVLLQNVQDPALCRDTDLPCIAALLGLKLNTELTVARQRREVLDAVALYKKKGTVDGFESAIRTITRVSRVEILEMVNFVLCTNSADKLTARTINDYPWLYEDEFGNYDPNKLVNHRTYSNDFRGYAFQVRIYLEVQDTFTLTMLNKIQRVLNAFSPVCAQGTILLFVLPTIEEIDAQVAEDYLFDTLEDHYDEEITGTPEIMDVKLDAAEYWMWTADVAAGESLGSTNSYTSRTVFFGEVWWDIIVTQDGEETGTLQALNISEVN